MTGLIKNQILKHLSKFTKNLSSDKISLSAMKGEGDLSNLELDEIVLTDLLALPSWLRLKRATCNKVTIKIQWTKLNSQPICLYLDEVVVEMETIDVPRNQTYYNPVSNYNKSGKYGFAEQIIDGVCLQINSVIVNFRSKAFNASIQISRIVVQSKTPKWQDGDLFMTRLKNDLTGEVMIFKEAEWQTLRIEANALDTGDPLLATTPLRLIANQSKIRITIKKKIADCSIISSRLQVNLDDLLWVLTDSQLTAALSFVNSLRDTIAKSKETKRNQKDDESETASHQASSPLHHSQQHQPPTVTKIGSKSQQQKAHIFDMYNITETSYHLYTGRIDLHLCDDVSPEESHYQRKVEGGAIQLVLYRLEIDMYPYHPAGDTRVRWPKYDESMKLRDTWASDLLYAFKEDVRRVRTAFKVQTVTVPSSISTNTFKNGKSIPHANDWKPVTVSRSTEMLESCIVVRLEDFMLFRVSTALDNKRSSQKRFLSSDKKQLLLPPEMSSLHIIFTEYYFPEGRESPVPHSNLYVVINPICLSVDYLTLLWMNVFSLNLAKKAGEIPKKPPSKLHVDIRIDALMPRIILPSTDVETKGRHNDLDGLQLQMSKVMLANCRVDNKATRQDLQSMLSKFELGNLFSENSSRFPSEANDIDSISDRFHNHVLRMDDGYADHLVEEIIRMKDVEHVPKDLVKNQDTSYYDMTTNSFRLNIEKDVWCVTVDQVWLEFTFVIASHSRSTRTLPLVESFPITIWFYQFPTTSKAHPVNSFDKNITIDDSVNFTNDQQQQQHAVAKNGIDLDFFGLTDNPEMLHCFSEMKASHADMYILMTIDIKVQVQIDHQRYWFLMNLADTVTRCSEEMESDFKNITGRTLEPQKTVLSAIMKEIEISFLFIPAKDLSSQLTSPDDMRSSMEGLMSDDGSENLMNTGRQVNRDLLDSGIPLLQSVSSSDIVSIPDISLPPDSHGHLASSDWLLLPTEKSPTCLSPVGTTFDVDYCLYNKDQFQIRNEIASVSWRDSLSQSPDCRQQNNLPISIPQDTSQSSARKTPDFGKSFNQAFSKITSKIGKNTRRQEEVDALDNISMTSGSISDDDDDDDSTIFEKIESQMELPAFEHKTMMGSDEASIVDGEIDSRDDASSFINMLNKKVVSIFSVNIGNVESVIVTYGKDKTVKAVVDNMTLVEVGNMEMEKFQALLSAGSKEYTKWSPKQDGFHPIVKIRIDLGQRAEQLIHTVGESGGYIKAIVEGIKTKLKSSTIKGVGDLFEDNKPIPAFLLEATIADLSITIMDDKMPVYLAEPKNTTIDLFIKKIVIKRGVDGVFHVGDSSSDFLSTLMLKPVDSRQLTESTDAIEIPISNKISSHERFTNVDVNQLTKKTNLENENDLLRQQLEKIGRMNCCRQECSDLQVKCEILEKVSKENTALHEKLERQTKDILSLKEERESLLLIVQQLQDDLTYSEKMRGRPTVPS